MLVGIQQRVLPEYRVAFFDLLASRVEALQVFAGHPREAEGIRAGTALHSARWILGKNHHLGGAAGYACWQAGLGRWLESYHPDVLVTEANPRLMSNYAAIHQARSMGIPVIGWGLGVLQRKPGQPNSEGLCRRHFLRQFLRQFDAMITYSGKGAEDYIHLGFDPERVFVAPNAVVSGSMLQGTGASPVQAHETAAWRRIHDVAEGPLLLFVGRLIPEKRLPFLLDACARLGKEVQLVIVGEGPERSRLELMAAKVFPRARFIGHRTGDALAACFAAADLFVLPGSGGLSIQEAMAFGRPVVVASGDGSQWNLVEEGITGFHLPANEPDALYRVLRDALRDVNVLQRMGEAAREKIRVAHNLDAMVDAFFAALQFAKNERSSARSR
jgi:glycosyltransferase involved in cell wall biosynthesis